MITIYFIGLSVFVVAADDTVNEILFPNALSRNPPDGTADTHADGRKARKHFAGALILDDQLRESRHESLLGRRVEFPAGSPTPIDRDFRDAFPSLSDATAQRPIELLPDDERKTTRVATRIMLRGGRTLSAIMPTSGFKFEMPVLSGTPVPERYYATVAMWTTDDPVVKLTAKKMWGNGATKPITLDAAHPVAYLYNFDVKDPLLEDFKEDPNKCQGRTVDHDFKWIFQVMDPKSPRVRPWQDYLDGDDFPAPVTDCTPYGIRGKRLVPVSTCFPTVWDGP